MGWTLSIHLLIHWVLHDSSFPALRDILDAASIQTPIQFSSKDFWGTPSRSQVCHEMLRVLYHYSHAISWDFTFQPGSVLSNLMTRPR